MKECYAVFIGSGQYDDYHAFLQFVTFSEKKAENWVDKYNKIVEDNFERLLNFNDNSDYAKKLPFCHDMIVYEKAHAFFEKTKLR